LIVATAKQPLPLEFSVEAGILINAIRTSLDILATSLAHRYNIPNPDDVFFQSPNRPTISIGLTSSAIFQTMQRCD
jgi:hypothetical protein